jgi:hypothetical protein
MRRIRHYDDNALNWHTTLQLNALSPLSPAGKNYGDISIFEVRMSGWLETALDALNAKVYPLFDMYWPSIEKFFDSGFFTAIVGSFAAAYAGARAAQLIAEKTRNKDEVLREIRVTNATTMVAFGICNTLLSAKKQHIKSLKDQFDAQRASIREALAKQQQAQSQTSVVEFHADYRILPALALPLPILQAQIFEKLSLHGRPIALVTTLIQSMDGLNAAIVKRNELVESYKKSSMPHNQLLALYFGFSFGGQVNQEYPDLLDAIYKQTDDGIFFGAQLCQELSEHGDQLAASFKKLFGKGAPRIAKPDFSKAKDASLMPNGDDYTDWFNMFAKRTD